MTNVNTVANNLSDMLLFLHCIITFDIYLKNFPIHGRKMDKVGAKSNTWAPGSPPYLATKGSGTLHFQTRVSLLTQRLNHVN